MTDHTGSLRRTLVVGVSGATWTVIDPLLERGRLPHLASLCERGMTAVAESERAPGDDGFRPQVAWATAATGCLPERHGVTRFFHEAADLRMPTMWDYWRRAGRSVGVYGWPGTWPPTAGAGFVVPSHLARDDRTWPPELSFLRELEQRQRLSEREGRSFRDLARPASSLRRLRGLGVTGRTLGAVARPAWRAVTGDAEVAALALRQARLELAADVFVGLCRRFQPQFGAFVTFLVDFASHRYWRYYEPDRFEPESQPPGRTRRTAVVDAYERFDRALGRIVAAAGGDSVVLVLSEHGMAPEPVSAEAGRWRVVLRPERLLLAGDADASVEACPVARWIAFRQPRGGDADALERLAETLGAARLVDGDRPLLDVWRHGDEVVVRLAGVVDLPPAELDALVVDVGGRRFRLDQLARRLGRTRSAMHDGQGVFALAGPGVPRGRARGTVRLADVAPTLMALAGLPVPDGLDGVALLRPPAGDASSIRE